MYAIPSLPDNATRARNATSLLLINLCLFSVMTLKDLVKLFAVNMYYSNYGLVNIAEVVLEVVQTVLMITTAVFFIMWFRRAYNNLHIAGARFLPYREGWAAGGWFVPIINWSYPYRIMNAIWVETPAAVRKIGEHYERPENPNIGWWWTFWLIGNIVASLESQLILRGVINPAGNGASAILDLISNSSLVIAAWLGMGIIKRISVLEEDLQGRYAEWQAYQNQQMAQQYGQQQGITQ